ncbi:CENP-B homolog protein 2-like protein [Tanacetum coccineum]
MTDEIRRALCKHNKDNPSLTQKQLQEWVHSNYGLQVSQATISNTVKRSLEYLSLAPERGDVKRHKPAKFPDLEKSLYEWILQYQEHVNMTGELIIEKAKKFMKDMYPVDTPDFFLGMGTKLEFIRDKVDQFEMKGTSWILDETGVPNPAKINVLDAMNLAISAWTMDVSANTIANCFRHCRNFRSQINDFEIPDEGGESTQENPEFDQRVGLCKCMDVEMF